MKRILIVILLIITMISASCGLSDWMYPLINEYEIWRINSNEIIATYVGKERVEVGIPSFIKEFAYDERYVCTRNVESIQGNNIFDEKYYILDTEKRELYGSFQTQDELKEKMNEYGITLKQWYRTSPDPNISETELIAMMDESEIPEWSYPLPNRYEVWGINYRETMITYMGEKNVEAEIDIPSFIKEFAYDERYVCTRNVESIQNNDIFNETYYMLDTEEKNCMARFGHKMN